ncbi:MAG: alkaline phosphatase family protein [Burkholderiaceae bacterium]|nr:alkaline phosphatase family protein [Burkholderiaceae bacterium]
MTPTRRHLLLASGLAAAGLPALSQPGDAKRLRIAFGSCARQDKPQPIWRAIAAARPDLFVFLGDNFYADARDEKTLRLRYEEFRAVTPLQAFRRSTPHLAIWDDHDFGDDDEGGDYPLKKLSQQLFCDEWQEPADSPRRRRSGVYESYRIASGSRSVQIILLDLRYNRTALVTDSRQKSDYRILVAQAKASGQPMRGWYVPNPDPAASMLGEEQWAWLEQQHKQPADLRLIGSSVQFAAEGTGWECWANFPFEQQRLATLIRKTRAEGVALISGDMHYADISRLDIAGGYPLWDVTSSGLTEVWDIPTPNLRRVSEVLAVHNFGLLDIDWASPQVTLQFSLCDVQGQPRLRQSIGLDTLRFPT